MLARIAKTAALAAGLTVAVAPAANAACADQAFDTYFTAFNDTAAYALIPNGDFERGTTEGWTLAGDAKLVADNAGGVAPSVGGHYALQLGAGSSATTPPLCVSQGYPTARMFGNTITNPSTSGSTLQVEVLYRDATRGGQQAKKLGTAPDEYGWDATRKLSLAQGQLDIMPGTDGNTYVQYRFTPLYRTTWRIDDVYVDPRLRS